MAGTIIVDTITPEAASGITTFTGNAVSLPTGTTAQRPTAANGTIRYNTETNAFEGVVGSSWYEFDASVLNKVIRTNPVEIGTSVDVEGLRYSLVGANTSDNKINVTGHHLVNNDVVYFDAATHTLPTGVSEETRYYIINTEANWFQVSTGRGGSAVNITANSSGSPEIYQAMNGVSAGEITIANNITVTVPFGCEWAIV
jgi:hypothetical protein